MGRGKFIREVGVPQNFDREPKKEVKGFRFPDQEGTFAGKLLLGF